MSYLDKFLKTKRERVLFYVTVSVIVISFLLITVILPVVTNWMDVSDKLQTKRKELRDVKTLLREEPVIVSTWEQNQRGIKLSDSQKRPEDALLLQAFEIQKECNIRYNRLDPVYPKKIPQMPNYMSYTLQVSFDSNLTTIGRFLEGMQLRGLYIDYIQLVPKSRTAQNPVLTATIRMGKIVSKQGDEKKNVPANQVK